MGNKAVIAAAVAMSAGLAESTHSNEDAALKGLLEDLEHGNTTTTVEPNEVIEGEAGAVQADEAEIEAAVASIETPVEGTTGEAPATPTTETPKAPEKKAKKNKGFKKDGSKPAKAAKPAGKTDEQKAADAKAKADAKAQREKERAEKKAQREAEQAGKPKTVYYGGDKVRRIRETMGEKLGEVLVLELGDAALEGEALASYQASVLDMIGQQSVKVKNRITLLLDFVAGKTKELNNVMTMALKCLAADGKIVSGDAGNLHQALLKKPYSAGAARAMGRNTINALVAMKVVTKGEKGEFAANPNSMIRAKVNGALGLSA
jgi:outer membrane biosynthesis protein TonB